MICQSIVSSPMQFSTILFHFDIKLKMLSAFQYNLFQENPTPFFFFHFPYIPTLSSKSNKNSERIFNLAISNWSYWSSQNKMLFLQYKHMMPLTLCLCMTTIILILGLLPKIMSLNNKNDLVFNSTWDTWSMMQSTL